MASIAEQLKQEGRQEGQQEALSRVLRTLIHQRFGTLSPAHDALIAAATLDELERAIERVGLASDLGRVFPPH